MRSVATVWIVTLLDQWTKHEVQRHFLYNERREVIRGWFDLRYIQNTGAAWGMLAGRQTLLIGFSLAMLAVIIRTRRTLFAGQSAGWLAQGLLLAGILGNLIDRMRLGYVVDFLDFYWGTRHFPAFNVADSAICVGVGLYILGQWRAERDLQRAQAETAAPAP